jgi:hypothetical protein
MDPSGEKPTPAALTGVLSEIQLGGSSLAALGDHAFRLTRELRSSLAAELASHCLWAAQSGETLFVVTDSPAWATRFRFEQGRLLATASTSTGSSLRQLRVVIAPPSSGGPFGFL